MYGARPVKRAVQRELETGLAKSLLRGDFAEEDTVVVDAPGGTQADHLTFRCARIGAVMHLGGACLLQPVTFWEGWAVACTRQGPAF